MASVATGSNAAASPRRQRYTRSSTTSVTQLLSDGYSSFINRITRRGPSEKSDPLGEAKLSVARSRYDDKVFANKNSTLANIRRYENNGHISPYTSLTSGVNAPTARKLNEDRTYSSYLGGNNTRLDISPLHTTSGINGLGRTDSFRKAHVKDNKSSPFTKRYPLTETNNNIDTTLGLGSTRSRLEDKYSSVLDRIAHQKKEKARREKDRDKTLEPEPSMTRGLMRSLTTAVFGENSFKSNHYSQEKSRDKTPFRSTTERKMLSNHKHHEKDDYRNGVQIPLISPSDRLGKDRNSIYRRHQRRSLRAEKSEAKDRKSGLFSLRPVDIDIQPGHRDLVSPPQLGVNETNPKLHNIKNSIISPVREVGKQKQIYFPSSDEDDDKTPVGDHILSERETRRKEIQGLIMKYSHLDEVYGRIKEPNDIPSEVTKKLEPIGIGSVVALPPELRSRHRLQRPRHLMRQAATPPVSTS